MIITNKEKMVPSRRFKILTVTLVFAFIVLINLIGLALLKYCDCSCEKTQTPGYATAELNMEEVTETEGTTLSEPATTGSTENEGAAETKEVKEPAKEIKVEAESLPDTSLEECVEQVKTTNPGMTDQQAKDNCYIITAVKNNDKSLCSQVSEIFRAACEEQFEE